MAETTSLPEMDISGIDLSEIEKEIGGNVGGAPAKVETSEKELRRQEEQRKMDEIRAKLNSSSSGNVKAPYDVVRVNRINGRIIGFVNAANDTIKISVKSVPVTGADGKKILKRDGVPEDVRKEFADGKSVGNAYLETHKVIQFMNSKPATPKGVIIGTPAGTDLSLTNCGKEESAIHYDVSNTDMVYHMMDMATAYTYLAYNYDGAIRESEEVLGDRARQLKVSIIISHKTDKDGIKQEVVRRALKPVVSGNSKASTNLLIHGNYIPMKIYNTVDAQNMNDEQRKAANLNVKAALRQAANRPGEFSAEDQAKFEVDGSGNVTSVWFNKSAPIEVKDYETGQRVSMVRIPLRTENTTTKNGETKTTYSYSTTPIEDAEKGPLTLDSSKKILGVCGWTNDQFINQLDRIRHANKSAGGKKKVDRTVSMETYLRGAFGHNSLVAEKSLDQLQAEIDSFGF